MPRRAHPVLGLALVAVLCAPSAGCGREARLRDAQARREKLLLETVPKSELWDEVTRKGELAKTLKETNEELARLGAMRRPLEDAIGASDSSLAAQRAQSAQLETQLAAARTELAQARSARSERESMLRGFLVRRQAQSAR